MDTAKNTACGQKRATRKRHPADDLSFTRIRPKSEWKGTTLSPRCWWSVTPTGDYSADNVIGRRMALEYLAYSTLPEATPCLAGIVREMPNELSGIEVAFLEMLDLAARAGRATAISISQRWDRRSATAEGVE